MSCGLDICYCQSNSIIYNILYCFNTSHVTLYRKYSCQNSRRRWVSIHLMLLFISIRLVSSISAQSVSIHLMLLFISLCRQILLPDSPVSIHLMLLFIEDELSKIADNGRFNTSHVTLYQILSWLEKRRRWFQYISCYSLSSISITVESSFRFNTSHVTLYRHT